MWRGGERNEIEGEYEKSALAGCRLLFEWRLGDGGVKIFVKRGLSLIVPGLVVSQLLLAGSGICSDGALDRQTVEAEAMCQIEEPSQTVSAGKYPWELLKDPLFHGAYLSVLGYAPPKKHWLSLSGPASRSKTVIVSGREYTYTWSCKQHECDTHSIHLLFDAREAVMFGALAEGTSISWLGNPPKCIQKTIEQRLFRK